MFKVRKMRYGVEIYTSLRFFFMPKSYWKTKNHPYFFYKKFPDGTWTLQIMRFEVWSR